jgi:hypothetical protein
LGVLRGTIEATFGDREFIDKDKLFIGKMIFFLEDFLVSFTKFGDFLINNVKQISVGVLL